MTQTTFQIGTKIQHIENGFVWVITNIKGRNVTMVSDEIKQHLSFNDIKALIQMGYYKLVN